MKSGEKHLKLKNTLSLVLILFSMICLADEISVMELKEVNEIMIGTNDFRKDANGKLCALVRVFGPSNKIGFEGNIVGDVEYKVNEHWVFLSPNTKSLKVKYEGYPSLMIDITKYIGSGVRSKGIYLLKLYIPDEKNTVSSVDMSASEQVLFGKQLIEKNNDTIAAIKWFRMAAEKGNGEAMCIMGDLCKTKSQSKKSLVKRIYNISQRDSSQYWYKKSADMGYPEGMYKAACSIQWWKNLKDTTYVRTNLERACRNGYAPAFASLGSYYESQLIDYNIENDERLDEMDKFHLRNNPQRILSIKDEKDNHRQSDLDLAEYWYKEGLNYDEANCAYALGNFYRNHKYSFPKEERLQKSFEYYDRAASLKHPEALHNLSSCYYEGEGIKKNDKKGDFYLKMAIENGYYDPHSYITLASRHLLKNDIANRKKAYDLLKRVVGGTKIYDEKKIAYTSIHDKFDAAKYMIDIEKNDPQIDSDGFTIRGMIKPRTDIDDVTIYLNDDYKTWVEAGFFVLTGVKNGDILKIKSDELGEYSIKIDGKNRDFIISLDDFVITNDNSN